MTSPSAPEATHPAIGASREQADPVSGILTCIIADLIVFAMLFTGFMVDRSAELAVFNESANKLNFHLGLTNLLILVTSGLCVVFAVTAAREGRVAALRNWILAGFVIGAAFGVSKVVEYGDKFADGISMHTNNFYMYYYALTGAHFLHFFVPPGVSVVLWPLMIPIEILSHISRPMSLSIRLFGNIFGEHAATSVFYSLAGGFIIP